MSVRVGVIGAGLTGLVAALDLIDAGCEVEVFESAPHVGGKIATTEISALTLPTGPDAFLARVPQMIELCERLGLGADLISPAARDARIFRNGHLHDLPVSLLGIPTDLDALASGGLVSAEGVLRASADLVAPDDRPGGDESVGALVRRRLGDEVLEYVVDPLLGGINAGDSDRLSVLSGVPQIGAARALDHSLIRAAQAMRARTVDPEAPVFLAPRGGMRAVLAELEARVRAGARVHTSTPVLLERSAGGSWRLGTALFDRVVSAAPAHAPALEAVAPRTTAELGRIEYSSVAMIVMLVPRLPNAIDRSISGVLVPRLEARHMTAVSFATNKWPHMTDGDAQVLRVSVGRRTDSRWRELGDESLVATALTDLRSVLGDDVADPSAVSIMRWIDSLPQYDVGHGERIDTIESLVAEEAPGVALAGAAMRGLGLPACVASGRLGAARILESA
ncbi:MAG: protoporphyrinogen oxidase [Acidimicrobiales bacterium]